ncbi:MAG: ABC transporter permease [Acidobacteriota bacterium]|nr:ABC transporter permease [Acidobacteriota bacterium]
MKILRMAWRNLWRNGRRTLVTVGAMTLALWAMVLYTSLMQGMLGSMESTLLDVELGEIQIHAAGYLERPSIWERIEEPDALLEALDETGLRSSARLLGGALVASGDASTGALLKGLRPERDARVSDVYERLDRGEWLDPADPEGVVLGYRLARTLGIDVGDELIALSQATDGSMANDLFRVRGVLQSLSEETDRATVFLVEGQFRSFFALEDGAHQVIVRSGEGQTLDAAGEMAQEAAAASAPGAEVKSWRDLLPGLANVFDSAQAAVQVVAFVVYVVIAIMILNAMLMAVFERIREFGVLKAIGVSPRRVLALILTEGALQAALAIAIGLVASVPALWFVTTRGIDVGQLGGTAIMGVSMDRIWTGAVSPATIAGPVFILLFIVGLAVLFPAFKAARISPIEAIHHQ